MDMYVRVRDEFEFTLEHEHMHLMTFAAQDIGQIDGVSLDPADVELAYHKQDALFHGGHLSVKMWDEPSTPSGASDGRLPGIRRSV
ncbi:hypothetical protein HHA02_24950 [Cobetia marina]|nr:hypothetical protein HHA02_24950 [Cobetia marina]